MRLRDVLEQPGVRLPVLAGEGELDRPAQLAYTTDLLDPGRYLAGGEVVLTGMMWRREPADSELFVAALAGAGVAALGAGEALLGPVPADLVEACRRHRLPLFAVPAEVSFREVTERINTVLWAEREAGALAARSRRRGRVATLATGADLAEVWPATGAWVLTCTGRAVAGDPGGAPHGLAVGRRLATAFLRADILPARCRIGEQEFHLDAPAPTPAPGMRFVACTEPALLEELVELTALDAARADRARRIERRLAAQLADALAAAADPAEAAAALHACGLPTTGPYTVLVASLPTSPAPSPGSGSGSGSGIFQESARNSFAMGAVSTKLHDADGAAVAVVEEMVPGAAVAGVGDAVVAVVAGAGGLDELRETARHLTTAVRGTRFAAGVSEPAATVAELAGALSQARHAHGYALDRPDRVSVVGSDELASHDLLLAGVPRAVRQAFADRLLAPLRAYDADHHADLVRTLQTFLACDGSWTRCASAMHLHVNTLRYRIRRIADLTGRDLDRFADRVDLYLALRLDT
ncbi:PucR family transcriptional regulator ligand-binding domain-containing protein [Catellatospora sp. NPDC049111]|uniref:PucR family transcriptional regulator ligand-binding domain-containing protein n=1 Tax=Catellatospora sp. NPDC049111 TaxID=3155271 RepID=UPI0033C4F0F0